MILQATIMAYDKLLNAGFPKYSALKLNTRFIFYVKVLSSLKSKTPAILALAFTV